MAKSKANSDRLSELAANAVAARAEYLRRYNAMQEIKPYLNEAIAASDAADNALQDHISELASVTA